MSGGVPSPVDVTLRDPRDHSRKITYRIQVADTELARDWHRALCDVLDQHLYLEKNFCFLGFPYTARDVDFLCEQLNQCIDIINLASAQHIWPQPYWIEDYFCDAVVRFSDDAALSHKRLRIKHSALNRLHNHFEILQGTVDNISSYYHQADTVTRYAIRQLNTLCHELESLVLSQRKIVVDPHWVRPSQITTFFHAPRFSLTDQHRQGFLNNGYDRELGGVYMHWAQIGKTLFEVWRDENAPQLTDTVCEAITHLEYYTGEFDIDWGRDVTAGGAAPWHDREQTQFRTWLIDNGVDLHDVGLSLGYLKIGQVDLDWSFGTHDADEIWHQLGEHLDIYSIQTADHLAVYDYCWTDHDYREQQMKLL